MPNERIISQRVVSQKVIGSANPIAKGIRNIKSSIGGICIGPVLVIVAIGMLFVSERLDKKSAVVKQLSLEPASEASGKTGMHKIEGSAVLTTEIIPPEITDKVLYYSYSKERYEQVEKVERETVTQNIGGDEVEQVVETTKLVDEWVSKESSEEWARFKLAEIEITPNNAKSIVDYQRAEYWFDNQTYSYKLLTSGTTRNPVIGDERKVITYISVDGTFIVIGEISNNKISGGDPFIVSNKSDADILSSLRTEENVTYLGFKIGSWLFLTLGLMLVIGPILALADFIPVAGKMANCLALIIASIVSAAIVLLITMLIKLWWLCLGLLIVGLIAAVVMIVMLLAKKSKKEEIQPK